MNLLAFFNRKLSAPKQPTVLTPAERPSPDERRIYRPWWSWDASGQCYRHTSSGEEIRYSGPIATPSGASGKWQWHRFDYVHSDLDYPLLVEVRDFRQFNESESTVASLLDMVRADNSFNLLVWRLDHVASHAVRQREQNLQDAAPSYGTWLRVEEAFTGATMAWNVTGPLGERAEEIAITGGWLNGVWRSSLFKRLNFSWGRLGGIKKDSSWPFEDDRSTIKVHFQNGFPSPSDFSPVPLDHVPLVWHEMQGTYQKEYPINELQVVPTTLMLADHTHVLGLWTWVVWGGRDAEDGRGPPYSYLETPALTLPGIVIDPFFQTYMSQGEPAEPLKPGPNCRIAIDGYGYSSSRITNQRTFEAAFGALSGADLKPFPGRSGVFEKSLWTDTFLDRPSLVRELVSALLDALPSSTGFHPPEENLTTTYGEVATFSLSGIPIAGMSRGSLYMRLSLELPIDPRDDEVRARKLNEAWRLIFA
jgi:hypothetical protein